MTIINNEDLRSYETYKSTLLCRICQKNIYLKKKFPTTVQICRLENIEHQSMKQVSYSGKYSLSASRAHQSHLQFRFSFVVGMLSLR